MRSRGGPVPKRTLRLPRATFWHSPGYRASARRSPMALYFFDVRDGDMIVPDDTGIECYGIESVSKRRRGRWRRSPGTPCLARARLTCRSRCGTKRVGLACGPPCRSTSPGSDQPRLPRAGRREPPAPSPRSRPLPLSPNAKMGLRPTTSSAHVVIRQAAKAPRQATGGSPGGASPGEERGPATQRGPGAKVSCRG